MYMALLFAWFAWAGTGMTYLGYMISCKRLWLLYMYNYVCMSICRLYAHVHEDSVGTCRTGAFNNDHQRLIRSFCRYWNDLWTSTPRHRDSYWQCRYSQLSLSSQPPSSSDIMDQKLCPTFKRPAVHGAAEWKPHDFWSSAGGPRCLLLHGN